MEKSWNFFLKRCVYDELAANFVKTDSLPQSFESTVCESEKQTLTLSQQF